MYSISCERDEYPDLLRPVLTCIKSFPVEHVSNILIGLFTTSHRSTKVLRIYVTQMFPQVFERLSYTTWRAVPILYINTVSTLIYSFADQLIIMISLALGKYFKIFNRGLLRLKGKVRYSVVLENVYVPVAVY